VSATAGRSSPQGDLEAIRRQLRVNSADLYRQLALYQQVLRTVLPRCVDQACFFLVTQVHPSRYRALPPSRRAELHQRIVALVNRCSSLLTVEQLIHLADQMGEERRQRSRDHQRALLERLGGPGKAAQELPSPQADDPAAGQSSASAPQPAGSVHLGFHPPLSAGWLGWGESGHPGAGPLRPQADAIDPEEPDPFDFPDERDPMEGFPDPGGFDEPDEPDERDSADLSQGFENSAFFLDSPPQAESGQASPSEPPTSPGFSLDQAVADVLGEALPQSDFAALMASLRGAEEEAREPLEPAPPRRASSLFSPPPAGGLLPTDPIALLAWLEGYEQALSRRLRNLSHALNGELLRAGLSPILLPANLLDAVLAGQVESQGGPANILRLQLPVALAHAHGPLQAQVLLLRCDDLELEQPQLRTVRRRLQQRRQEIRRMAHAYHRLQRRLQAREAEALWQHDIRTLRSQPEGPPPPL